MSTIKTKKVQLGTDATSSNNFTIYQPATPDGTLRIGVGDAENPTEVGQFNANGYKPQQPVAFRAFLGSNQAVSVGVFTKMTFNTEEFDTNSNYDHSTNYRFTPTVAGYYQVDLKAQWVNNGQGLIMVHKNGASYAWGNYPVNGYGSMASALIYMNGSTDYIEGFAYFAASNTLNSNNATTYFNSILIAQA